MRMLGKLSIVASTTLILASSVLAGGERSSGCIQLWPDLKGFESMLPDEADLKRTTQEQLTGATARLVVYVEHWDGSGRSTPAPFPQEMFIFATTSDRYVARIVALPAGHGWFGPF